MWVVTSVAGSFALYDCSGGYKECIVGRLTRDVADRTPFTFVLRMTCAQNRRIGNIFTDNALPILLASVRLENVLNKYAIWDEDDFFEGDTDSNRFVTRLIAHGDGRSSRRKEGILMNL